MDKHHVAFFIPSRSGHINPTLPIATELLQRGHRVTYAIDKDSAPKITQLGAEAIIYQLPDMKLSKIKKLPPHDPENLELLLRLPEFFIPASVDILSQITAFYESNKPDLILYDYCVHAGHILAHMWGIPAIQTCPDLSYYNGFFSEIAACYDPPASVDLCKKLDRFFHNFWPIEKININFIPKFLQPNGNIFDQRFFFIGSCFNTDILNETHKKEGKTIVISPSITSETGPEYFKIFIEALRESPWHVILAIGDKIDPTTLGPLPSNFKIKISPREFLSSASLFIGPGGTISTLEALANAVPVILIPQDLFHVHTAYCVEQLGLGISLKKTEITADILRNTILKISADSGILSRVIEAQKEIKKSGGIDRAVTIIEEFFIKK
jgi:MGT family glycosyltransferase